MCRRRKNIAKIDYNKRTTVNCTKWRENKSFLLFSFQHSKLSAFHSKIKPNKQPKPFFITVDVVVVVVRFIQTNRENVQTKLSNYRFRQSVCVYSCVFSSFGRSFVRSLAITPQFTLPELPTLSFSFSLSLSIATKLIRLFRLRWMWRIYV